MAPLSPIEEEALKDPDVLLGFFSNARKRGDSLTEQHYTHLLKRLFDLAGEAQPTSLQKTSDARYTISTNDLQAVVKKLEGKLLP